MPAGCVIDARPAGLIFFACDTPSKRYPNLRILKEVILRIGGELCSKLTEVKN